MDKERRDRERERKEDRERIYSSTATTAWRGASWASTPVQLSPLLSHSPSVSPPGTTSASAPTTPVSTSRSDVAGDLYKVGVYGERVRQMEREREARRDKGKEKDDQLTSDHGEGGQQTATTTAGLGLTLAMKVNADEHEFAKTVTERVKLFCCPICHRWDIVRIHRYIAATIKYRTSISPCERYSISSLVCIDSLCGGRLTVQPGADDQTPQKC
jgi:hypothetical protein